jgi:hypothetical protein
MNQGIKVMHLDEVISATKGSFTAYVLPAVREHEEKNFESDSSPAHFVLGIWIASEFTVVKYGLEILGDLVGFYRGAMRLEINVNFETSEINVGYKKSLAPSEYVRGVTYKGVDLFIGQAILIAAAPSMGKTYTMNKILDKFEEDRTTDVHRIVFGERKCDVTYENTTDCDSAAPIEYMTFILYKELATALRKAYSGINVVISIDSLTRMVEQLTNKYSHSHMLSGGISASAFIMVGQVFRMTGFLGAGSLTMVGTCLWSSRNGTWTKVYSELSSIATAEFHPDIKSGKANKSRKSSTRKRALTLGPVDFNY